MNKKRMRWFKLCNCEIKRKQKFHSVYKVASIFGLGPMFRNSMCQFAGVLKNNVPKGRCSKEQYAKRPMFKRTMCQKTNVTNKNDTKLSPTKKRQCSKTQSPHPVGLNLT